MERILYDFCPECAGLVKNGVCMACGYEMPKAGQTFDGQHANPEGDTAGLYGAQQAGDAAGRQKADMLQTPVRRNYKKIMAGLFAGGVVFIALLFLAVYFISKDLNNPLAKWNLSQIRQTEQADVADRYVPDPSDEFYVEITDALRYDLPYQVQWKEYSAQNEEATINYYAVYPELTGEVPNMDALNQAVLDAAKKDLAYCRYVLEEGFETCSVKSECYVTWMDEEKISIVFQERIYYNGVGIPRIYDINLDLRTGSVMSHQDMVDYSAELSARVRRQNEVQNSTDLEDIGLSDADILELLQGDGGTAFYTPVGLEIGFNYNHSSNYGWLTVTLKE